jgi:hypothetical protein
MSPVVHRATAVLLIEARETARLHELSDKEQVGERLRV